MSGIKYYALDENEEVPYEFVVIRNVNGEPEFCASFVNTNSLTYENGALLKFHERNDELRAENAKLQNNAELLRAMLSQVQTEKRCYMAENAKLRELVRWMYDRMDESCAVQHPYAPAPISYDRLMQALARARELGVEVE